MCLATYQLLSQPPKRTPQPLSLLKFSPFTEIASAQSSLTCLLAHLDNTPVRIPFNRWGSYREVKWSAQSPQLVNGGSGIQSWFQTSGSFYSIMLRSKNSSTPQKGKLIAFKGFSLGSLGPPHPNSSLNPLSKHLCTSFIIWTDRFRTLLPRSFQSFKDSKWRFFY